jgi:hypothetical protein
MLTKQRDEPLIINNMNEYFSRNNRNELILVSNGIEHRITLATIDGIEYFYQYPTIDEMERGQTTPKRRLVSEISTPLPE